MLRKIILLAIVVLAILSLAHFTGIQQGSVIIFTPHTKITIHLMMACLLLLVSFVVCHYLLRLLTFLKSSPKAWRQYQKEKTLAKHEQKQQLALLHLLTDQPNQAEYHFKQAYLTAPKHYPIDLLLAIQAEIETGQILKAQNDLSELQSRDTHIRQAMHVLQTKIYAQKNQPKAVITNIKQIKNYRNDHARVSQLCENMLACHQYSELLNEISQRSALSAEEKKYWGTQAHAQTLANMLQKNQVVEAKRYAESIPIYYSRTPEVMRYHLHTLLLDSDQIQLAKMLTKHLDALVNAIPTYELASILNIMDEKSHQQILNLLNHIIDGTQTDKSHALALRAHLFQSMHLYEKAIADYQSLISLHMHTPAAINARLSIHLLEKMKKNREKTASSLSEKA